MATNSGVRALQITDNLTAGLRFYEDNIGEALVAAGERAYLEAKMAMVSRVNDPAVRTKTGELRRVRGYPRFKGTAFDTRIATGRMYSAIGKAPSAAARGRYTKTGRFEALVTLGENLPRYTYIQERGWNKIKGMQAFARGWVVYRQVMFQAMAENMRLAGRAGESRKLLKRADYYKERPYPTVGSL